MTFKELREASGMTRAQFAEYFGIPYRTTQNWELGLRECPEYLLKLMKYKLKIEAMFQAYKQGKYVGDFVPLPPGYKYNDQNEVIIDEKTAQKVQEAIKRMIDERGGEK